MPRHVKTGLILNLVLGCVVIGVCWDDGAMGFGGDHHQVDGWMDLDEMGTSVRGLVFLSFFLCSFFSGRKMHLVTEKTLWLEYFT